MILLAMVLGMFMVSGCATNFKEGRSIVWTHFSKGQSEFEQDKMECVEKAITVCGWSGGFGVLACRKVNTDFCLKRRGWTYIGQGWDAASGLEVKFPGWTTYEPSK